MHLGIDDGAWSPSRYTNMDLSIARGAGEITFVLQMWHVAFFSGYVKDDNGDAGEITFVPTHAFRVVGES